MPGKDDSESVERRWYLPLKRKQNVCVLTAISAPIVIGRQKLEELTKHVLTLKRHPFVISRFKQCLNT